VQCARRGASPAESWDSLRVARAAFSCRSAVEHWREEGIMKQSTSRSGPQGNASALEPTTRRMLASILATEEEHADDLVGLMRGLHE
jgi:hypothetical protein